MATAHQVSVITNSCVKPPIHPKSGLSATQNERSKPSISATWAGRDADYMDPVEDPAQYKTNMSKSVNFDTANESTLLHTLPAELADLSDDDFYDKLSHLKTEHKKTLEMCERLYNDKLADAKTGKIPQEASEPVGVATLDSDYALSTMKSRIDQLNANLDNLRQSYANISRDSIKDMSASKPPTGRPKNSEELTTNTLQKRTAKQAWATRDQNDDYWKPLSATSSYEELHSEEDTGVSEARRSRDRSRSRNNVDRIQDMWENFSVDDYAPRQRSSSLSRLASKRTPSKEKIDTKEWTPKITIPKPFSMTLREASKESKKTKAMQELEEKRKEMEKMEEAECQKKIKATPIPAHVYLPLYDEIMEERESKRRYNRQASAELTKSVVKPFKFSQREEEKKQLRHKKHEQMWSDTEPTKKFKANPFPSHLFTETSTDKLKEDEEYRKIRVQMRAEELLKSASLPPNMKARGEDYMMGKSRSKVNMERARKAGLVVDTDFKPRVNDSVPDFEEMHKKFHREMSKKKFSKEATVCKPFNLRTNSVASSKSKIYDDISNDEETLKENRWPFTNPRARPRSGLVLSGSLSTSLDSIPTKMTASADLRQSKTKSRLQQELEEERRQFEAERRRKYREHQLKKEITQRAAANDKTSDLKAYRDAKLREYRSSEKARRQEYREQLREINNRVKSRPLLFEQAAQRNAQQAADRRYKAALERAGLDEQFINKKGSKAGSSSAYLDEDDDQDELSQVFSSKRYSPAQSPSPRSRSPEDRDYTETFDTQESSRSRDRTEPEVESDVVEDLDDM